MVVEWLCPGLRPTRSNRPRLLHCKVILLDEHELLQDVLVSSASPSLPLSLFLSRSRDIPFEATIRYTCIVDRPSFFRTRLLTLFRIL